MLKVCFTVCLCSILSANAAEHSIADVSYDSKNHTVSFTAIATDCGADAQLEFMFVGPGSDRAYESLFTTVAPISKIVEAFEKASFPTGEPIEHSKCRFWNVGNEIEITPSITDFIKNNSGKKMPPIIYTGGQRDANGVASACTNMPEALFALYNCPQSLIQLDEMLEQSPTYGCFTPLKAIPKGRRVIFTVKWKGGIEHKNIELSLSQTNLLSSVEMLKKESHQTKLNVLCDFSQEMTLKSAIAAAQALSIIDSPRIKINGIKNGQLYYKAYLPKESWRERSQRLAQPPEVRIEIQNNGLPIFSITEITEDWSDTDSLDPKLSATKKSYSSYDDAAKEILRIAKRSKTIFLYGRDDMKLKYIFALASKFNLPNLNIYVFTQ